MATNRDLLKEAIADAKAVKHMAIANAKAALEEAFTPQVNALFSAKLREMEELEEDIHEASETEEVEEDEIVNEVEEEEEESTEEEAPEEEESEEGETKIEDMTEEDLAKLIEDIMLEEFPELAKMRGEEAEETPEEEGGEEEGGEEMDMDMDMDLAELLREIEDDSVEESEINLDELLAEIAEEDEDEDKPSMMETELRSELAEAYTAIDVLRSELTEINMLNAKLLYTNKIFKSKNLSESQKVKVLSSFDKAVTVKEVKLVYETLNEGLKVKTAPTNNNVGRASKTTLSPTVKKPIIESNEAFTRMQKLAGLI